MGRSPRYRRDLRQQHPHNFTTPKHQKVDTIGQRLTQSFKSGHNWTKVNYHPQKKRPHYQAKNDPLALFQG